MGALDERITPTNNGSITSVQAAGHASTMRPVCHEPSAAGHFHISSCPTSVAASGVPFSMAAVGGGVANGRDGEGEKDTATRATVRKMI